jgi:hypothetical protein
MTSSSMGLSRLRDRATVSVEEAAALLGVSRGIAYEQARRHLATNGQEGLPVLRFGKRLVVPIPKLLALLGVEVTAVSQESSEAEE